MIKEQLVLSVLAPAVLTLLIGLTGCGPQFLAQPTGQAVSPLQTPRPLDPDDATAPSETWPTLTPPPTPELQPTQQTSMVKGSATSEPTPTRPPLMLSPVPVGSPPPDLQSLCYVADNTGVPELRVIGMDMQGRKWSEAVASLGLSHGDPSPTELYPSPDGKYLAITLVYGERMELRIVERSSGRTWCPFGEPKEKCSGSFWGWTLDNQLLFRPGGSAQLEGATPDDALIVNIGTGEYKPLDLTLSPSRDYSFVSNISLNPGDARLAFSVTYPANGKEISEIWTMQTDGQGKQLIRKVEGGLATLSWSPAGKQLVYLYQPGTMRPSTDPYELWLLNADGTGERLMARGQCYDPTWSPDGRYVAFVQVDDPALYRSDWRGPGTNIYIVDTVTGQTNKLSSFEGRNDHSPTWSPDSKFVAFVSVIPVGEPGVYNPGLVYVEVWVASVDGQQLYVVSGTVKWPGTLAWLPSELSAQKQ